MSKKTEYKIFISWSGEHGKTIAKKLKQGIENDNFPGKVKCFVSDMNITCGEDGKNKINNVLKGAQFGIVCVTKDTVRSPWIHYEAGALAGNDILTIPLLFNCSEKAIQGTPLQDKQCVQFHDNDQPRDRFRSRDGVQFHDRVKFCKMISDINEELKLIDIDKTQLDEISKKAYVKLQRDFKKVFGKLKGEGFYNTEYIYPKEISTIKRNTVFVSAPMSTLSTDDYQLQRKELKEIVGALSTIGFSEVTCPAAEIEDKSHFEGKDVAVKNNFRKLKQVDSFVLIVDKPRPSSSFVELGYAIALCKKTVIFYKKSLPYLIKNAGDNIPHVRVRQYSTFADLKKEILSNKMLLFSEDNNE